MIPGSITKIELLALELAAMYAIVGCSSCSHLWLIEGRSATTQCPRCGSQKAYEKRKKFLETEDPDHAREVRASMLASRQGESERFAALESFADLEADVADGVIDDEAYLEDAGLDAESIEAAGDRDPRGSTRSGSKQEIVERALSTLDRPTEREVVEYANEHGISAEYVERTLDKLTQRGAVSESRGRYRLL